MRECYQGEASPADYLSDGYFSNYSNTYVPSGDRNCGNDGWSYVGVGDHGWAGWTYPGQYARWTMNPPSGTSFSYWSTYVYSYVAYGHVTGLYAWNPGGWWDNFFYHESGTYPYYGSGNAYGGYHSWSGSSNELVWQVHCPYYCYQSSATGIWLTNMQFALNDTSAPSVSGAGGSLVGGGWRKPQSESVSASTSDQGGGVQSAYLRVGGGTVTAQQNFSCTTTPSGYAAVLRPCGNPTYSTSVSTASAPFGNGINSVSVCARDYANSGSSGNESCQSAGQVKVDGESPSQSISGDGWSPAGGALQLPGSRTINVSATDGVQGGSDAQRRSGAKRIELRIWKASASRPATPTQTQSQTGAGCGTSQDSCPLNASFTFNPADYADHGAATTPIKAEVVAVDEAGNETPIVDGTNRKDLSVAEVVPETTVDSGPSGSVATRSASFGFSTSVPGSTFECRIDLGAWTSCVSPKEYPDLTDGPHNFDVRAVSPSDVVDPTPATRQWEVVPPPETTIDAGPSGTIEVQAATLAFSSSQSNSTFECRLDGGSWSVCTSPKGYTELAEGPHAFDVRATNSLGDADPTPATRTWEIDLPPTEAERVEALTAEANPDAVGPSVAYGTESGETLEPTVAASSDGYTAVGTQAAATIRSDSAEGVSLETESGSLTVTPTQDTSVEDGTVSSSGDAVVFPDTDGQDAHTVIRPQPAGVETYTTIEQASAPTASYSWQVDLPGPERLEETADGAVKIIDADASVSLADAAPRPEVQAGTQEGLQERLDSGSAPPGTQLSDPVSAPSATSDVVADEVPPEEPVTPAAEPTDETPAPPIAAEPAEGAETAPEAEATLEAETDEAAVPVIQQAATDLSASDAAAAPINAQIASEEDAADLASLNAEDVVVAEIKPPPAIDAAGNDVQTSLSVQDNQVTMIVDTGGHEEALPIVASSWITVWEPYEVELCCRPKYREESYVSDYWDEWAQLGWWYPHWMKQHAQNWWRTMDIWGRYSGWFLVKIWGNYYVLRDNHEGYIYTVTRHPVYSTRSVYVGERPYKEVRYRPREYRLKPNLYFGYTGGNLEGAALQEADVGGANLVRIWVPWCTIEPSKTGGYNFNGKDGALHLAQRLREVAQRDEPHDEMSAILVPFGAPPWAQNDDVLTNEEEGADGCGPSGSQPEIPSGDKEPAYPPGSGPGMDRWEKFLNKLIAYLRDTDIAPGTNNNRKLASVVAAIEVWNEPNFRVFWGGQASGNPDRYANVFRRAWQAAGSDSSVRSNLPRYIDLIVAGLKPTSSDSQPGFDRDFMTEVLARLERPMYRDGLGIHAYANDENTVQLAADNAEGDYQRIRNRVDPPVPMWVTEFGYPSDFGTQQQKDVLLSMISRFSGAQALVVHRLIDGDEDDLERRGMGTVRAEGVNRRKPAFCALGRFARDQKLTNRTPPTNCVP